MTKTISPELDIHFKDHDGMDIKGFDDTNVQRNDDYDEIQDDKTGDEKDKDENYKTISVEHDINFKERDDIKAFDDDDDGQSEECNESDIDQSDADESNPDADH